MEYEVLIISMGTILSSISFGTMKSGNLGHQLNKLTFSSRWIGAHPCTSMERTKYLYQTIWKILLYEKLRFLRDVKID